MTARPELIEDAVLPIQPLDHADEDVVEDPIYYLYDDENNFVKLRLRDMSGSGHEMLKQYLMAIINWLFRAEKCAVYGELNFYETGNPREEPLYPDVAVLKGQEWRLIRSYRLGVDGPPPDLVIELLSDNTRRSDLFKKPDRYQKWGTAEYFAYDLRPRQRRNKQPRLWGWRMNEAGVYTELTSDNSDGRLWSEQLGCWMVPDNTYVRLYDKNGRLLLSEAERLAQRLRELGEDPESL